MARIVINPITYEDCIARINEGMECFAEDLNISDPAEDMSQNQWAAMCWYIGMNFFSNSAMDFSEPKIDLRDIALLSALSDVFIYLCSKYNKIPLLDDFAKLLGIDGSFFNGWRDIESAIYINNIQINVNNINIYNYYTRARQFIFDDEKLRNKYCRMCQKIVKAQEQAAAGLLVAGKRQPVGLIAYLNHYFGWAAPAASDAPQRKQLTIDDIQPPKLSDNLHSSTGPD